VPVIMYHSVVNFRKSRYIVSEKQLENDFALLKENGYEAVFPSQLVAFVKGKAKLPKKPVVITFDDGHYNNMVSGLPLLEKYGFVANFNIVGHFAQVNSTNGDDSKVAYSYLTWEQIKECHKSGLVEIGNHTYNMHKFSPRYGIGQRPGESIETYSENLKSDVMRLENCFLENCGFRTKIFAYPFGKYSKSSKEILKGMGFEVLLTCNEQVNKISVGDFDKLLCLGRFNREGNYSSEEFLRKISK